MIVKNNISSTKGVYIIFFFIAVHLAGCQELAPTSDDQKNQDIANLEATINQSEIHDQFLQQANRHFIHLAEQIPGFGGVYLEKEGTRLVLRVTDQDQIERTAIEDYVKNYLEEETPIVGSAVDGGIQAMELRFDEATLFVYNQAMPFQ